MVERLINISRRDSLGRFTSEPDIDRRKCWDGKRYGKLIVIETKYGVQRGNRKRTICVCKCDCGNIVEVCSDKLSNGKKVSCGCDTPERRRNSLRIDMVGEKYGRLTVVEMLWQYHPTKCKCICDCGAIVEVVNAALKNGNTMSCGCLQKEKASIAVTKDFSGEIASNGVKFIQKHRKLKRGVWEWECKCPYCENTFMSIPAKVLNGSRSSCGCQSRSTPEAFIDSILSQNQINYKSEYRIDNCRDTYPLPFDFALFNSDNTLKCLIEFQGIQHYKSISLFGGDSEFELRQRHDEIKRMYCEQNNIILHRLPYTMSYDSINNYITNIMNA